MAQKEQHQRGTKRKRQEGRRVKTDNDGQAKFSGKLHSGLVVLQRAAKKAKVFETQKIVKRLKKPGKDSKEDETELEAQLKALKILDTDLIMRTAFVTRLRKDGVLTKDERMKNAIDSFNETPPSTSPSASASASGSVAALQDPNATTAKVEARIRSSKHVAEVMKDCVESLRSLVLGKEKEQAGSDEDQGNGDDNDNVHAEGEDTSLARPQIVKPLQGEDEQHTEASDFPTDHTTDFTTNRSMGADDEKEEDDGFGDSGWESDPMGGEGSVGGDGDADGDDGGWESGSLHTDSDAGDEDEDKPKKKKLKVKSKTKTSSDLPQKPPVQAAESMFLPTLMNGFIGGGSSDGGDAWSDDGSATKVRKNRRGQRARRKIWEQKYGRYANHVKKSREAENAAKAARIQGRFGPGSGMGAARHARPMAGGAGRSSRTGPSSAPRPYTQQVRPSFVASGGQGGPSGVQSAKGSSGNSGEGSLHPSWTAKRKAKEKEKFAAVGQGSKIKFD